MTVRIGIDIGGTFTDGVAFDPATSSVLIDKKLTTSADLSDGFMAVFDELVRASGIEAADIAEVLHASTVATNALLERKGARVGLIVTEGFRDVLEIGRQVRSELYNVFTRKPAPLVPRSRVYEVRERLRHDGSVRVPLDMESVTRALQQAAEDGVDSLAICLLHSYRDGRHEQEVASAARRLLPGVVCSVSSEVAPEIKEYWRASTTCVNAYVGPVVRRYLDGIQTRLSDRGFSGSLGIMHSGGGIEHARSMMERPFQTIESGPAAGVAGAAFFARMLGHDDGLSFDMGGTTAKAGLILGGVSRVLTEFEVAAEGGSGAAVAKASGYPVLGEVVDLVEVGAGGGSLAWIDDGGHLRVGPQGAGSDPGPVCYALGGTQPTITDANLILGRLDADHFLGGAMHLDTEAARSAIAVRCAEPLGISVEDAARGIIAIANARMVGALRLISIERGHDPRDFCLVGFGGAGPTHALALADELSVPVVLIPPNPGVASAWGLLLSAIKHDARRTVLLPLEVATVDALRAEFAELDGRLQASLEAEDVAATEFTSRRYVEARYHGQASRLRIEWSDTGDAETLVAALAARFHAEHRREFGYHVPDEPVQILTAGVSATAQRMDTERLSTGASAGVPGLPKARRPVVFDDGTRVADVPVFDRRVLTAGQRIDGPALIEEFDTTTLVTPAFRLEVGDLGVLRLEQQG
jgi:N-methylhydantoinase A/oxoprolinase/acetone carboxylase beta subunit